jgi:uncharacterized membrane protein SpoIIM required for sporulation
MEMTNYQYSVVTALFILIMGILLGGVLSYSEPKVVQAAQTQYSASVVNQTYSGVQQQVNQEIIPVWVGIALFLVVFVFNNLIIVTMLTFLPRYFDNWLGVVINSYILFSTGFIPAAIFVRVMNTVGIGLTLAAFVPHGIFEFSAVVIAGGIGFYYLMSDKSIEIKNWVKQKYIRYVVPLIIIAAAMEVFITPLIEHMLI